MSFFSIIVPTHNEQANIAPLYSRLKAVFDNMPAHDFELIFCDDSTDSTPKTVEELSNQDARIKLVRLSRRFGQAIAVTAGIDYCTGDAVIVMDADLQDPPEALPRLIELWLQGNQVVYVERESGSSYLGYRTLSFLFYRLMNKLSSVSIPVDAGEFRLLDRKVVEFMKRLTERSRYLRGLTVWPGFQTAHIRIERPPRLQGATNYNLRRSLLVAIDGIVGFSIVPLRLVTILGALITAASFLAGLGYIVVKIVYPGVLGAGWTSLFVSIFFMGGVQLMILGVLGEYIGRIFIEVQNRPVYWVDYDIGFDRRPQSETAVRRSDGHNGLR
jgi:glycosyltransferase involved in cell wall biosynthesis